MRIVAIVALTYFVQACASLQSAPPMESVISILQDYAQDYTSDPHLTAPTMFGVKVADRFYTIQAAPASDEQAEVVWVSEGAPSQPTFYFTIESEDYLRKLDAGVFNALTLMGKAFASDVTPMDVEVMDGFEPPADFGDQLLPMIFHFWTRGNPEIVNFSPEGTRVVHGANLGVFYYQPGLRSAWFDIRPGQHVNKDPDSRMNPFPSMFIMIQGEATARVDGVDSQFREGQMMLVPAGVAHEFLNEGDKPAFGFLFMFGDGA